MERFNAETATLAANAVARAQDRLRELVGAVEAGMARGATEDELRALLKDVRKD
jgi:hypothetical protein